MNTQPFTLDFSKLQPINGQPGQPAPSSASTAPAPAMVSTGTIGNPNTGTAQAPAAAPANAPQGVTLDFSKLQPIGGAGSATTSPDSSLQMNPDDNIGTTVAKGANAVGAGIGEGLLSTLNGGAEALGLPHQLLQERQQQLQQENAGNPILNDIGYGGETLAEFMMGDSALKGLATSDKFAKVAKVMKTMEASPRLMQALKIGAQALRTGTVAGAQTYVRTGGDTDDALENAAITGAGGAALSAIPSAVRALRGAYSVGQDAESIQPALQQGLRNVLSTVAKDAGVTPSPSASIRDVAGQVADSLEAKSKGIYQQLDDATGGRFQRFEDKLRNINNKLRETAGLDDDAESALEQKRNEIETSQAQAFEDAKAAGVDPALVDKARLTWKQAKALTDLSTQIQRSTEGVRPELAPPGSLNPETVNPAKVSTRLNNLYDSGRLQDAVGPDNAKALVQHADNALSDTKRIADRAAKVASRKRAMKSAAWKAAAIGGAGGVGGAVARELLK